MKDEIKMFPQQFTGKLPPSGHVYQYNKTGSRADMAGELYEVKMTLLLFLRGINCTAGFYLASNVDGAGAFDDILFKFKPRNATDTFKTCFLQLKHKQRKPVLHETEKKKTKPLTMEGLYSNNGDFSLGKYHESYCEVVDRMKMCTASNDVMFNGRFEDTWFVIYTNAPAERKLLNHEKTEEYSNPDKNILSSGGDNEFIFHFHEESAINYKLNKQIPSDLSSSKKEFLDVLKIYCGQASESELNTFIELEVEYALQTSKDITKSISKDLTSKIADWWRDSSDVLTETSCIWQEIITARIETMNVSIRKYLDTFNVNYNTQTLHSLYSSLNNSPVVFVTGADTKLTSLKILQTLDNYYTKQFIFIDLKSLLLKKPEVSCLWQSSWCHVLVVDCSLNDTEGELEDLVNDWSQVLQGKLILIVNKLSRTFPNVINHTLVPDCCMRMEDLFSFMQLDLESQTQIMDTKVIFQGIPISLGSVVKQNTEEISGNILGQLLTPHYKLSFGPRLEDIISYYIPRRLKRFDCLKNDIILNNYRKEYYVISSALEQEIQELLPYGEKLTKYEAGVTGISSHFVLADQFFSEQDFVNVCQLNQNKSFHWLLFDGDSLVWKQSNNNVTLIRENLDSNRYNNHSSAHNVVDDRVVLVTAEPGMGKSTLVTHLAKQVQEDDPSLLIIRVNLNDTTALLEEIDEEYFTNIDNTIRFLLLATISFEKLTEGINEDFETKLFKSRFKTFENVVIFLDGFDEISPDFTNEVISLLKCLMKTKVKKLWVTSRIVMRDTLEVALSLISYTLQPFTVDDQHSFLIGYWNSIMNIEVLEQLKQFAVLLLEVTSKSLNDHEKDFTSIPLQTFMLAESFEQEMTCFTTQGINGLPTRLNLLDLYERFIEKKQNVYYKDKAKWDTSKAASRREIQRLKKLFISNHMNAALLLILSAEQLGQLGSFKVEDGNDFLEDIANVDEKRGIIDGMIGNKPHFIHRTFAEYFLALYMSQHLASVQSFIQNYFFNENYQTIRYFFDCILTKGCKFHNAVLNGDREYFQFFLSKENDVNLHDKGNRTALHYAVSYPDLEFSANQSSVQTILDHGAHVNAVDTVLQWSPLRYADAIKSWSHIDKLLCNGGNQEDLVNTKNNICDGVMLCKAAEQGYLKLMAFVLDCDVDINIIARPRENSTLLHIAAEVGNIQSVDFLISRGANVDCHEISSRTPLHLAAFKGHLPVIESLVNGGGDIMCRDEENSTPLHWAASYGHIKVVEYLVGKGADIMPCSADYLTPLHLASGSGHLSTVQFLKEKGADIIARDLYGTTPLQEAAERGRLDVVNFLVESGADVNTRDLGQKTPLHWACRSGHLPVAEFLVIKGAEVMSQMTYVTEALHWAADKGHESVVMFLLEKGTNVDARDEHGATPLLLAAGNGHLKVVECLVRKGASVKLRKRNGQSPLQLASAKGHLPIVCFLVDNGADVMSRSECGNTPLHSAAQYGHLKVVQYLVARGALIDAKDNENQTPLEVASVCQQWDTVQWLSSVTNTNVLVDCDIADDTTKFRS